MPVIRDILKINQIARDSRHFEGKSILTTFLCLSPYVRIQKLGWEIYDFFPWPPVKNFLGKFLILLRPPLPLLGIFPKLYLVINYEGFPKLYIDYCYLLFGMGVVAMN